MKILQNQAVFTPPYSSHVKYLYDAIPVFAAIFIKKLPYKEYFEGFIQYFISRHYDICVTVGHRQAIIFALLNRICLGKRKQVAKELFIDETALSSRFTTWIYRWAFKELSLIITNSSGEIPYMMNWLRLPSKRFKFLAWPSNIPVRHIIPSKSGYIFAAGRSLRDWKTFFEAVTNINYRCVVVASNGDISDLDIPKEVSVYCDITHDMYLSLLEGAKVVVVPLKNTFRSIGQAVILEAMALGKPIVCSKVTGVIDYIQDGLNGIFYNVGDPKSLRNSILKLLNDEGLWMNLAKGGQKSIEKWFNKDEYSKAMFEVMKEICVQE